MNAFFYSFRSEDLLMIGHIATTEVKRESGLLLQWNTKPFIQCKSPNAWQNKSLSFFQRNVEYSVNLVLYSLFFILYSLFLFFTRPALKWTLKMGQFTMLSPIWELGQLVLGFHEAERTSQLLFMETLRSGPSARNTTATYGTRIG